VRRITCEDLALGFACKQVLEAETEDEVVDQALVHARDEHATEDLDPEQVRALLAGRD
jgi:predicted small metal-binding protein